MSGRVRRAAPVLRSLYPAIPPVLLAVFPAVSLFEHNETEVTLEVLWEPVAFSIVGALALYGIFLLIFRNGPKAGALASLCVFAFLYYGIISEKLSGSLFTDGRLTAIWLALFALGAFALSRTRFPLVNLTLILIAGAAVLLVIPAVKVARFQIDHPLVSPGDPRLWASSSLAAPSPPTGTSLPDIYLIVPDDYARADILRRRFHYDDSAFLAQLKRRGFRISHDVRSPYSDSEMNISSAVNMGYLDGLGGILGQHSQDVRSVKTLMEDNRAAQFLQGIGYHYVHLDSDEVTFGGRNPGISPVATPDSFMTFWLQDSLLGLVGGEFGFSTSGIEQRFREAVSSAFDRLDASPAGPSPKFVFFHTLLPHDPYVFDSNGQPLHFPAKTDEDKATKFGMTYYLRQLQFLNKQLLATVDAILAQSRTPPVIVIQSDEGFEGSDQDWSQAVLRDMRVKGLAALYLPGHQTTPLPHPLNTVNTLRFVFNTYLGAHYPLLPSHSYPELDYPYQFREMQVR